MQISVFGVKFIRHVDDLARSNRLEARDAMKGEEGKEAMVVLDGLLHSKIDKPRRTTWSTVRPKASRPEHEKDE